MKTKHSVGTAVCIEWSDALFSQENPDPEGLEKPLLLYTIGWIARSTRKYLTVASEYCPHEEDYRVFTRIPTGMVVSVNPLALKRAASSPVCAARGKQASQR